MAADSGDAAKKSKPQKLVVVFKEKLNTLVVPASTSLVSLELMLGIEVDKTAGANTFGQFDLGQPGSSYNPLEGFTTESSHLGINEGNLHSIKLDFKDLANRAVRVSAGKSYVLDSYDKDSGNTTFKTSTYPTEELVAEIFVFKGEQCLTGNHTFQEIIDLMKVTRTGIARVLVRLDQEGFSIQDCIIDSVVHIQNGERRVQRGR